jgi:hypothetical protein
MSFVRIRVHLPAQWKTMARPFGHLTSRLHVLLTGPNNFDQENDQT